MDEPSLIVAAEIENSNAGTNYIRAGVEYNIYPGLFLRGGIDKLDLSNADFPARPSLGFSYLYKVNSITFGFDYAFALEPYSAGDVHIIGLNILF
jgi:hypothetical protein